LVVMGLMIKVASVLISNLVFHASGRSAFRKLSGQAAQVQRCAALDS
jgi:hypothetical protein